MNGRSKPRRWAPWLFGLALWIGNVRAAAAQDGAELRDCDDAQAQRIYESIVYAGFQLIAAGNDLSNIMNGGDTTRFERWFGDYSTAKIEYVSDVLLGAYNALGDASFDCGCNIPPLLTLLEGVDETNTVAWVEHNSSRHMVHLCPLYFSLDAYEFGVGTLIHELTHFYTAEDVPEGVVCAEPERRDPVTTARRLAVEFPDQAIINADNFRLYTLDWDPDQPSSWTCAD